MSKSLTIVALLASLTLGGCLGGTGGGELIDLSAYQRGKFHFNAGQYGLAVGHFQSAVRREPGSVEALNGLAASYDKLGRFDLSARYYERALVADPESAQTLNNIGYSYLLQERFDLAVAYLRDAQARDRKDPVVLANRSAAEVSYQDADLKRSAEEARSRQAAAPAPTPSRPRIAALAPSRQPVPAQSVTGQSVTAQSATPWIERTASKVQTLVTRPQVALLGVVEAVGIPPQLAAYRPQQPTAAELLPDHVVAPMTLDARPSPEREAPDRPRSIPVSGLAPAEAVVAGLDPLLALEGAMEAAMEDIAGSEMPRDGDRQESQGAIAGLLPEAQAPLPAALPDAVEAIRSTPVEVVVASLDPSREAIAVAPSQGELVSAATTALVAPEVVLSGLDPLDALEDDLLEAEKGLPQEAAIGGGAGVGTEFEVASLNAAVPVARRIDASAAAGGGVAVAASLPLVEVSNGTGRLDMAARIRDHLEAKGIVVKRLTNAEDYRHQETVIFYRSGWRAYAEKLAAMLPAVIDLDGRPGQDSDVRLELGGDLLEFDRDLYYAVKRSNGASRG